MDHPHIKKQLKFNFSSKTSPAPYYTAGFFKKTNLPYSTLK